MWPALCSWTEGELLLDALDVQTSVAGELRKFLIPPVPADAHLCMRFADYRAGTTSTVMLGDAQVIR